jgi:GrpB-like predicted nucleotidyltransferase (UPF0157 family)
MPHIDEPVSVSPHQPSWPAQFAAEHRRIGAALHVDPADLEHIGSTAVPDLAAKPIVDLMLGINSYPPSPALVQEIERLGYEPLGEAGVPGRLYFRLRSATHANLHVVRKGSAHWVNNLALREHLRTHASARERYAQAKLAAIAAGATSLLAYSAAKAKVLSSLLQEALATQNAGEPPPSI